MRREIRPLDVLFVNPRDLVGASPYVKLASLAAVILQQGLTCDIIEPAAEKRSNANIVEFAEKTNAKIICISIFPSTIRDAYELINLLKASEKDFTIIIEGYMINADVNLLKEIDVPYGIRGDADYSFYEICKRILNNEKVDIDIPGVIIYRNDEIICSESAYIRDINELPIPAFDLLPIEDYYSASTNKRYLMIFTTRGCPYDCSFCASAAQMKYRYLTVENTIKQLKWIVNDLKVEWVEFMDLTFTVSLKRTKELCEAIIAEELDFEWGCETRADRVNEEILTLMKKAGCQKITFGVESGSEALRAKSGKVITNEKFKEVFAFCHKIGIKTMANFIFGHPDETAEDMQNTIKQSLYIKPFNVLYTRMIPLPDVEIFDKAMEENNLPKNMWYEYMRGKRELPVYVPKAVTRKQLDKFYKKAYLKFYLSPRTIKNYLPLFTNVKFFVNTVRIFSSLTFGSTKFK